MPGMPKPNSADMEAMLNCIVTLTIASPTTNTQYLAKQMRDIVAWQIHTRYMETISLYKHKNVEEYFCQFWFKNTQSPKYNDAIYELEQKGMAKEEANHLLDCWTCILSDIYSLKKLNEMYPNWSFDLSTSDEDSSSLETLMERCNIFPSHINGFMKILRIKKGN
jgi:glutathionylspermidine synthase